MASSIQLLRSNNAQERPFPGNLLDGQPAINTSSQEPGLFFKADNGTIVKIGPAAITSDGNPPNFEAVGQGGNSVGELWLDKSLAPPVLKVYDGVGWVDAGSGGGGGGGDVIQQRWIKTAAGGETTLSGADDSSQTLSYTQGLEEVMVNGAMLTPGLDYTTPNNTTISLNSPLIQGDLVVILAWVGVNEVGGQIDAIHVSYAPESVPRTVEAKLKEGRSVEDFGAVGNGADDTPAFTAFFNAGGGYIPNKPYLINSITITNKVDVKCDGTLKLRSATPNTLVPMILFESGAEGSSWDGGVFDGNTALFSTWVYRSRGDWHAMNVACARVSVSNLVFRNWLNVPFIASGDYLRAFNFLFESTCATGPIFGVFLSYQRTRTPGKGAVGQLVDGIVLDNVGRVSNYVTLQQMISTYSCYGGKYSNVLMIRPTSPPVGVSYAVSGHTDLWSEECSFTNFSYISPNTDDNQHLAISLIGTKNCTFDNSIGYDFAGLGLEVLACVGCTFTNIVMDGNFKTTAYDSTNSKGLSVHYGAFIPGIRDRSVSSSKECVFTNCYFNNNTQLGADIKAGSCTFNSCRFTGNGSGIAINDPNFGSGTPYFPNALPYYMGPLFFNNCIVEYNGRAGLSVQRAESEVIVSGGRYANNGSDATAAATSRSGIVCISAEKLSVSGAILEDTQEFTRIDGVSYIPNTSTNVQNRIRVVNSGTREFYQNQKIKLIGAGPFSTDVVGTILAIQDEFITLQLNSSTTLSSSGNTFTLSGQWTSSGNQLNGVGGNALTEIKGTIYINDGSSTWRRVTSLQSNNSMYLEFGFPTAFTNATLIAIAVDVEGIPSQTFGARIFGTDPKYLKGNTAKGNLLEKTLLSSFAQLDQGSEYWRKTTTVISGGSSNVVLMSGLYNGAKIAGVLIKNNSAITGGGVTGMTLQHTDSTGAVVRETLKSNLSLSAGVTTSFCPLGYPVETNDRIRASFTGGDPTSGEIVMEVFFVSNLPQAF
jgi:hypothetical protein